MNEFGNQGWRDVWKKLEDGDLDRDEVWEGYRDELLYGLDEVDQLLNNVDTDRVVLTSDHGNAVGEWTVILISTEPAVQMSSFSAVDRDESN